MSAAFRLCGLRDPVGDYPLITPHRVQLRELCATLQTSELCEIPEYTPLSNQGNIGSCAANAWGDMLEMVFGLEQAHKYPDVIPTVEQLSRLWLYWVGRCVHDGQLKDEGTYLYAIASALMALGVAPEYAWPYDTSKVFVAPGLEVRNMASDNRVTSVFRLDDANLGDDLELCVRAHHPVVFGGPIAREYQEYDGNINKVFDVPDVSIGGHAQIICGVRYDMGRREFKLRNSWGNWGIAGHAWVTDRYIVTACHDFWSASRMLKLLL